MASLRRTVEGWMGNSVYEGLGDQPSTERSWGLLRDLVGQHLFGTEFVPVPFLESAAYFNQLFVFIKKQSILSTIGLRPPTYKVIGNMDYLVNRDVSTWSPQFDYSPWDVADGQRMYSEYDLRIMSNQLGIAKSVEFTAIEAHARSAQPPTAGAVTIHRNMLDDLNGVNTLYVITDVVLASYVKLVVRIGDQAVTYIYDRDMPIAFRYKKYKLRNDGTFITEMTTSLKVHEKEAVWLQPLPQPVPTVPLWDNMRRLYHGGSRRKMRSNLTIPTPCEAQEHIVRRPREEAGGVLRLERPLDNDAVVQATDVIQMNNAYVRHNLSVQIRPQSQQVAARGSVSMETLRGSDEQEE